jgi:predicted molibdopterin-dependent oxidoreductase YjgC
MVKVVSISTTCSKCGVGCLCNLTHAERLLRLAENPITYGDSNLTSMCAPRRAASAQRAGPDLRISSGGS